MPTITPEGVLRCDDAECPCQSETKPGISNTHDPDGAPPTRVDSTTRRTRRLEAKRRALVGDGT